jgi:hypothetical protein
MIVHSAVMSRTGRNGLFRESKQNRKILRMSRSTQPHLVREQIRTREESPIRSRFVPLPFETLRFTRIVMPEPC